MDNAIIKCFTQHGVTFTQHNSNQSSGVCPFCDKEKFFVNPSNGLWDCKTCAISGNIPRFLYERMKQYRQQFKGKPALELSQNRGLKPQTLTAWGIGYDPATKTYMIPTDGNQKRTVDGILRYQIGGKALGTSGTHLQLMATAALKNSDTVWITEGVWDGGAMLEMLEEREDVYSSPGAGTFPKNAAAMFAGKQRANIVFDNDEAGRKGARRTGNLLNGVVKEVRYLRWPISGGFKDGYDVRDLYRADRKNALTFIEKNLHEVPPTDELPSSTSTAPAVEVPKGTGKGLPYEEVLARYQQWLRGVSPALLDVIFGTIFANRLELDPLWVFLVGPPGCGKTEHLMTVSEADRIECISTLTPHTLISGANFAGGDPSLLPKLNNKTLIVKDFTVILGMQQNAREEIFSILRDAYDGKCEKPFGNGIFRRYKAKFGIIGGVTKQIEAYYQQASVLGERFIRYQIRPTGVAQTIFDAINGAGRETEMRASLKITANEVLSREVNLAQTPPINGDVLNKIASLAQWVALMRGVVQRDKYTGQLSYIPTAEVGTRLAKQFVSLAKGIALFRQSTTITDDIMRVVVQVGKDTAPDRVEATVRQLYVNRNAPMDDDGHHSTTQVGEWTRLPQNTMSFLLQDLEMLKIVRRKPGRTGYWKLDPLIVKWIEDLKAYEQEERYAEQVRAANT
jgi:hypothetical protein